MPSLDDLLREATRLGATDERSVKLAVIAYARLLEREGFQCDCSPLWGTRALRAEAEVSV